MADKSFVPGWTGDGGPEDDAWNTIVLGDVYIPGMCTVSGLEGGLQNDRRPRRGKDGHRSRDLGIKLSKFCVDVWLTEDDWPLWLVIFPKINPRTVGRERRPVEVVHPEVNLMGITQVRIVNIKAYPPTARGGKRYVIDIEEWFAEPVDTKTAGSGKGELPKASQTAKKGDPATMAAYVKSFQQPDVSHSAGRDVNDQDDLTRDTNFADKTFPTGTKRGGGSSDTF